MIEHRDQSLTQRHAEERRRQRVKLSGLVTAVCVSIFLHLGTVGSLGSLWPEVGEAEDGPPFVPVTLVITDPVELQDPDPDDPDHGQIVDLPQPVEEEVPVEADYLAEHARVVEEETRSERFRLNPEVLAPTYSREDRMELADVMDLDVTAPSTGATPGQETFQVGEHGSMASIPSRYRFTNKEGVQAPVPSSHSAQDIAGAPNNDLLREQRGEATLLSTKRFLYAAYINQIRRLVNFYWSQQLDNVPPSIRLAKSAYDTVVRVDIAADGTLDSIRIIEECGSPPLDNAVVTAFEIAGPFPPPPAGLVDPDGRARLPEMLFEVNIGQARASYQGIDPRAGVQFPGILKAPR